MCDKHQNLLASPYVDFLCLTGICTVQLVSLRKGWMKFKCGRTRNILLCSGRESITSSMCSRRTVRGLRCRSPYQNSMLSSNRSLTWLKVRTSSRDKVCAVYSTPFDLYGKLIRPDQFIIAPSFCMSVHPSGFCFRSISSEPMDRISPNFIYALISTRSRLGLLHIIFQAFVIEL